MSLALLLLMVRGSPGADGRIKGDAMGADCVTGPSGDERVELERNGARNLPSDSRDRGDPLTGQHK